MSTPAKPKPPETPPSRDLEDAGWIDKILEDLGVDTTEIKPIPPFRKKDIHGHRGCPDHSLDPDDD